MNKVFLIGRLGRDPELIELKNEMILAKTSIATTEFYKKEEHTEWHNVVCFDKTADFLLDYFQSGDPIAIEGKNRTSSWEDDDGNKRYKTEVVIDRIEFVPGSAKNKDDDGYNDDRRGRKKKGHEDERDSRSRSRSGSRGRGDDDEYEDSVKRRKPAGRGRARSARAESQREPEPENFDDDIPF